MPLQVRLGRLRRMTSLHAGLLTLLALGVAGALPTHRTGPLAGLPRAPAAPASMTKSVATLLAITADSQSLVSQDDAARAENSAIPLIANALQSADPFNAFRGANLIAANRAQQCLALAMYYEAGFEGRDGRRAVAQVVLNRLRHPAYPHDVCSVVFQRSASNICQFTFACDGAMQRVRLPELWRQTMAEAEAALRGQVYSAVGMATHYHAEYVFPRWAVRLEKVAVIGSHLFYRWPGGWGLRGAFNASYNGSEPALAALEAPVAELIALPPEIAVAAGEVAPIQSANEAGFVDPSKGWIPRVSKPHAVAQPAEPPAGAAAAKSIS